MAANNHINVPMLFLVGSNWKKYIFWLMVGKTSKKFENT